MQIVLKCSGISSILVLYTLRMGSIFPNIRRKIFLASNIEKTSLLTRRTLFEEMILSNSSNDLF